MTASPKINWGILACGHIARKFTSSARAVDSANLIAVASQTPGKAAQFAATHEIGTYYDSYAALLADPEIDAVYVANTHNFHHETVLQALDADKAVLCEKPLAINARQASEMIALARERKVFLMEGMWTRFLPPVVQIRRWIEEDRIGTPRHVYASFGIRRDFPPEHRLINPDLAGGVLLDLGIYPLSMASMIAKGAAPCSAYSSCEIGETGVDVEDSLLITYPNNLVAHLTCGLKSNHPGNLLICGDKGTISLPPLFIGAQSATLSTGDDTLTKDFPSPHDQGFRFEIEAVNKCLNEGKIECDVMPLDETLQLAQTMDAFRKEWGVKYKGD